MKTGWELYLIHYGSDGAVKNGYIAPLAASYTNSLANDEPLVFSLNETTYNDLTAVAEFDIIEVMIRNRGLGIQSAGGDFVRDFVGIVRGSNPDRFTDNSGQTVLTWQAPEQKHILSWRRVGWPAGVADRSVFVLEAAETVAKTLITYNATGSATVGNGRHRAGSLATMGATLSVEADGSQGSNVSLTFAGAGLLEALAAVCELGGDYYQIEWQGGSLAGDHEYAITWGRGADKSSGANRVLFSIETNTMGNPRRRYTPAAATVAITAGQGQGADREIQIVNGADYSATNDIELFVDARDIEAGDTDGLTGRGESKLIEAAEVSTLEFDVLQTGDIFYSPTAVTGRKTYHVGDRVLANYGNDEVRRIRRAMVDFDENGQLAISIETELWE